jgi:bacteriophage CI repressor helix-turn-helix domain|nr:helix-turn-helix domain-containing protein [uncultured Campylobacter sp.]
MNADEIIGRLRFCLGAKNDTELAEILEIPYKTLATWKTRGVVPMSRIQNIVNEKNISLDWLLNGTHISNNTNSVIVNGSNNGSIVNGHQTEVTPDFMEVIELYKQYGNTKTLQNFKNEILKIKNLMEGQSVFEEDVVRVKAYMEQEIIFYGDDLKDFFLQGDERSAMMLLDEFGVPYKNSEIETSFIKEGDNERAKLKVCFFKKVKKVKI